MRLFSRKLRAVGLMALLTGAGIMMPGLPASAQFCTATHSCVPDQVVALAGQICTMTSVCVVEPDPYALTPDIFGDVGGYACGGLFTYEAQEGSRLYYSGPILGATYVDTDVQTKRMRVTCSVETADTVGVGTVRGSTLAQSVSPLNNVVSAAGLTLEYWSNYPGTERLWLCTTVTWIDRVGVGHTHYYDADPNKAGAQCLELLPLLKA